MGSLGCGQYEVYFKARGGDTFTCRARDLTSVSFSRVLNEVSEASITIAMSGQDEECCACLGSINPWEHEIAIYRDGTEVWCGPIVNGDIDLDTMVASFSAKDLFAWTDFRWIELYNMDFELNDDTELTEVWDWILTHAYNQEPWNMDWQLGRTGIPLSEKTYPGYFDPDRWGGSYPNAGDELRTLVKSGVDFTVIRRTLIGGDIEINPPGQLPVLLDKHWAKLPKITISGGTMATEVGVAGGNGGYGGWDDDQMWIERPYDKFRIRYGLLQKFFIEASLDDEDTTQLPNAITQEAFNLRELKKQPFVYVTGGQLASDAPVDFDTLIPGAVVKLALTQTCRVIQSNYRLTNVNVTYDGTNEGVALQLTPEGATALRT